MADETNVAQRVMIVDDDLGFVWWLGEIFSDAGCRALPALSCGDAVVLAKRLGFEPDLIILNPNLRGASKMLKNYVQTNPLLKIVTIGPPLKRLGSIHRGHAILERPSPSDLFLRRDWLVKLQKLVWQVEAVGAG
jgi:hypothetical protein